MRMKGTCKRAFTITELVIVIAVIAILAAVLIPTFVYVVEKARRSADEQTVSNMNTVLLSESVAEPPADVDEVREILKRGEYENYVPVSSGQYFGWLEEENVIVLYEVVDGAAKILYPAQYEGSTGVVYNLALNTISTFADVQSAINGAEFGSTVRLAEDLDLTDVNSVYLQFRNSVTFDLGGNTLTLNSSSDGAMYVAPQEGGYFVLQNGTIREAEESKLPLFEILLYVDGQDVSSQAGKNIQVTCRNLEIVGAAGNTAAQFSNFGEGSVIVLEDVNVSGCVVFTDIQGEAIIKSGTYTTLPGDYYSISSNTTLTIEGGTFNATGENQYNIFNSGKLSITGGSFNYNLCAVGHTKSVGMKNTITGGSYNGIAYNSELTLTKNVKSLGYY